MKTRTNQAWLAAWLCLTLCLTPIIFASCAPPEFISATSCVFADFSDPLTQAKRHRIHQVLSDEQFFAEVATTIKQDLDRDSLHSLAHLDKWLARRLIIRTDPIANQYQLAVTFHGGPFSKSDVSLPDVEFIMAALSTAIEERLKQDDIKATRTEKMVLAPPF